MAKEAKKKDNKHFFKDFKAELKRVVWPTAKQVINNTSAVIVIVIITGVIVLLLDLAFEALNTYGINNLKSAVQSSVSSDENIKENDEEVVESTKTDATENSNSEENSGNVVEEDTTTNESSENEDVVNE